MKIYDISMPIHSEMVSWPGDPGVQVKPVLTLKGGDDAEVSQMVMGSHTGTHVDAFSHFKAGGRSIDEMDLAVYCGPCRVMAIAEPVIDRPALERQNWHGVDRVLFKTLNSRTAYGDESFKEDFVHIAPDGAEVLIERGVKLVGIDYLSVEGYHAQGAPCHHKLMDSGVYIVEGLYLHDVSPGDYELICLPLKIRGGDGAPARVILREGDV